MRRGSAVLHLSLLALTGMLAIIACDSSQPKSAVGGATVPAELQPGESKFHAYCSACHGPQGTGTQQGPPLVHKIYEPNHHGDAAFQRGRSQGRAVAAAATNTVRRRLRQLRSFLKLSKFAFRDSSGGTASRSYSMMYHSMPPTDSLAVMIAGQSSSSAPR